MKNFLALSLMATLVSCASMTEKIPGYTSAELSAKSKELKGLDRNQLIKALGKPIAEGQCYGGGKVGVGRASYRMVYLKKETARYIYALDMNNKKTTLHCTMVDLSKNKDGNYVYTGYGVMEQTGCNQSYGAILNTRNTSKCEQIYK